jgi:integrase
MRQNGTILKRGGGSSFTAIYCDPKRRDARGRKKQIWRSFPTREAAEAFLDSKLGEIRSGHHIAPTTDTWAQLFAKFDASHIEHRVRIGRLAPSTASSYRSVIRTHLEPYWGPFKVLDMDRKTCRAWAETLTATREDGEPLSNKSMANIINLMSTVVEWAKVNELVTTNWVSDAKIDRPATLSLTEEEEIAKFLTEAEIERMLTFIRDDGPTTPRVIAALGLLAGLRRGEMAGLTWIGVKWDDRKLRITQAVSDGVLRTQPKSEASRALIDIPATLLRLLHDHKASQEAEGRSTAPGAFVLQNPVGKLATKMFLPNELSEFYDVHVLVALKLRDSATPHALRHTYASILIKHEPNIKYVSMQLRHANIQITLNTYGHVFPSTSNEAMKRLDAYCAPKVVAGKFTGTAHN